MNENIKNGGTRELSAEELARVSGGEGPEPPVCEMLLFDSPTLGLHCRTCPNVVERLENGIVYVKCQTTGEELALRW